MSAKVNYKNIVEIITDSYSPAVILPENNLKIHYSSIRHAVDFLKTQEPFCNLKKGDIVSIALPNSMEFIITFFTLLSVQAVANPINLSLNESELTKHFDHLKPKLVISSKNVTNYQVILDVCVSMALIEQTFQIRQIIRKLHHEIPHHTAAAKPSLSFIHISGPRLDASLQKLKVIKQLYNRSDIAVILHTHGTTGTTKLVPLSHGSVIESIYRTSSTFQLTEKDSSYLIMPMYHSHGLIGILLTSFFAGSTVLFPKATDLSGFWPDICRYGVTWFSAVPHYHKTLLELPRVDRNHKSKLRFVQSCGDRMSSDLWLELERFLDAPVITSYTLTEASHLVCTNTPNGSRKLGSQGRPVGVQMCLINEKNEKVNGVGEIAVSGQTVFDGYWNDPSQDSFIEIEGTKWFKTGDLGWFDEMGCLIFGGRCLDRFVVESKIISPAMLDQILTTHPAVKLGVFYGVLNAKNSHDIHACVEFNNPKKSVSANSLRKWMASFIPSNIPVQFHFMSHIPQTSMGKVQRFKLKSIVQNEAKL